MEGSGIFGDVAMVVGDLAITKGIPYLSKKGEAGRYYASEAIYERPQTAKESNKLHS